MRYSEARDRTHAYPGPNGSAKSTESRLSMRPSRRGWLIRLHPPGPYAHGDSLDEAKTYAADEAPTLHLEGYAEIVTHPGQP
jgi:hypothetical protein